MISTKIKGGDTMDENIKLFRTAVRGFNKEDVVDYIEKMNFSFQTELDALSRNLRETESKLAYGSYRYSEKR